MVNLLLNGKETKFDFARATDITDYAKKEFGYNYDDYEKIFICPDVNDFHLLRVMKDVGDDYETVIGSYILEQDKIQKDTKSERLTKKRLDQILEDDDLSNWDFMVCDDMEEVLDNVSGGFGIN